MAGVVDALSLFASSLAMELYTDPRVLEQLLVGIAKMFLGLTIVFIVGLVLLLVLAHALDWVYQRYVKELVDRHQTITFTGGVVGIWAILFVCIALSQGCFSDGCCADELAAIAFASTLCEIAGAVLVTPIVVICVIIDYVIGKFEK